MRHPAIRLRIFLCALLGAALLASGSGLAAQQSGEAAIASAHPLATAAGHEILKHGGNAFDAAVAVAAALAVVEPYSSGLGGGGFWLLHRARDGFQVMVDARETAPQRAAREIFLDADGKPSNAAITASGKAAGIPGTPAALAHVARTYGRLPLAASLAPAIRYAREGFAVDPRFARIAAMRERRLQVDPDAARIFLVERRAPAAGHVLRQPELAATLERLAPVGRCRFLRRGGGACAGRLGQWRGRRVAARRSRRIPRRRARAGAFSVPRRDDHRGGAAFGRRHRARAERSTCSSASRRPTPARPLPLT